MRRARTLTRAVSLRREAGVLVAETAGLSGPLSLLLVAYDLDRVTHVGAGENTGHRLREYCIVRAARAVPAVGGRMTVPDVPVGQGVALIVQDEAARVQGAVALPPV